MAKIDMRELCKALTPLYNAFVKMSDGRSLGPKENDAISAVFSHAKTNGPRLGLVRSFAIRQGKIPGYQNQKNPNEWVTDSEVVKRERPCDSS